LTPATRRMRGLRIRTSVSAAGRGARPAQTRAPGAHGVAKLRQLRSACRRPITQARIAARQGADAGTELGPQAADTLGESQRAFVWCTRGDRQLELALEVAPGATQGVSASAGARTLRPSH